MGKRGWNLKAPYKVIVSGDKSPQWKGDLAKPEAKRIRAQKLFKNLNLCEHCQISKAVDRHHIDGNTGNNNRSNIMFLCRSCHMKIDGRMTQFVNSKRNSEKPIETCLYCGKPARPARKGRCHACNERFRRNGFDTPPRGQKS